MTATTPDSASDNLSGDLDAALRQRLAVFQPLELELIDDSALHAGHVGARAGGRHYRLRLVSAAFAGKSTVARHRLIYAALGELMRSRIHALSIVALAPGDFS